MLLRFESMEILGSQITGLVVALTASGEGVLAGYENNVAPGEYPQNNPTVDLLCLIRGVVSLL